MDQDIYFPRWPVLERIQQVYHISSRLLLVGGIIFGIICIVACVSLWKIFFHMRAYRKSVESQKKTHITDLLDR